ncbi:hypothetical protein AB0N28_03795 [Streptomyces sp. NPDC051130]|uniref:hypothetical protein n=1 Tax=Streptomyces sp. NPDC051130 TaxID=3157223 RepID=UPI00342BFB22
MATTFAVIHDADAQMSDVVALARKHAAAQEDVSAGATWRAREPDSGSMILADDVYQRLTITVFEWDL